MDARPTSPARSPLQRQIELRLGRDLEELLRDLYVERRHSDAEIADALGVARTAITNWRIAMGIARDERGPVDLA